MTLQDPTLTIEEFARLAARKKLSRMAVKRLVWTIAERSYLSEVLKMSDGKKLRAAKIAGVRRGNLQADLKRLRLREVCLSI
jgi:transcriptional regulator with GAF, ATPase, and Fis domain